MSSNKKSKLLKNIFKINIGCGYSKPKLTDIIQPKPKSKTSMIRKTLINSACPSSSSSWDINGGLSNIDDEDEDYTSTTISLNNIDTSPHYSEPEKDPQTSQMVSPCTKVGASIAVVKDSDDPYHDFRNSMLQMILTKEISSRDDLCELLECFLQLNSPCQHDVIVQAFTDIWNNGGFIFKEDHAETGCVVQGGVLSRD